MNTLNLLERLSGSHALLPLMLQTGILFLAVWLDPYILKKRKRIMLCIILLVLSFIALDLLSAWLITVKPIPRLRTIESLYTYSARPLVLILSFYILNPDKSYAPFWCLAGLNCAIYMTTFHSAVAFVITPENVFYRGPLGYSAHVTGAVLLLYLLRLSLEEANRVRRAESLIPVLNVVLIALAVAMDSFLVREEGGLSYLTITTVSCCLFYYIWLHLKFVRDHEDALMMEQRVRVMLSQIQPHFLYNSLTVIQDLCRTDPSQAEAATVRFARYLRGNMDSLLSDTLISFSQELEHTREYLTLEKLRFEEKLTVRLDIAAESFRLPALTLQPIAENAVRYGVRGNPDGRGEVVISTREYPDRYEVTVSDNGPGFDPAAPGKDDGRAHIGIQNVRSRLDRMCGGNLAVQSAPGEGTTVTITLPKEADGT